MLVLTRKQGQRVTLKTSEGEVFVEIVRINGKQVRVGILAPSCVPIVRTELENHKPTLTKGSCKKCKGYSVWVNSDMLCALCS